MTKLELLQDWYRPVWVEADLAAIDRYFAPLAGADGILPYGQVGAEDFRVLVPALRALIRDLRIEIDRSVETGDWLWDQFTVRAMRSRHSWASLRTLARHCAPSA